MTERARIILETIRAALRELEKLEASEQDAVNAAMMADLGAALRAQPTAERGTA